MFDLTGKGALVTGASGGIGEAIARGLRARGANVAISGTREERLKELAADIGEGVHPFPCNLHDREAIGKLAESAEEALGQVDILVNNAGITRDNLYMRMTDEEWDDVIAVNLTSVFTLTRGGLARHDAAPVRPRRQYCLHQRNDRKPGTAELCGVKGRYDRNDEVTGPRGRDPRHHGQLHRSGLHRNAYDGRVERKAA